MDSTPLSAKFKVELYENMTANMNVAWFEQEEDAMDWIRAVAFKRWTYVLAERFSMRTPPSPDWPYAREIFPGLTVHHRGSSEHRTKWVIGPTLFVTHFEAHLYQPMRPRVSMLETA